MTNDLPPRLEQFTQTNGKGILELRGSGMEIGLWVAGAPLVFDAADCGGSIGRFTILLSGESRPEIDAQIARAAAQGFSASKSLVDAVRPLLDLMPNGNYDLSLQTLRYGAGEGGLVDWHDHQMTPSGGKAWIYADGPVLIFTQPYDLLDDETILNYAYAIERGAQPAAIVWTARGETAQFVLDGHHKFAAYWILKRDPPMLVIESEPTQTVSLAQARALMSESEYPEYVRYKEVMERNLLQRMKDHLEL
jgi:hypothetical protein